MKIANIFKAAAIAATAFSSWTVQAQGLKIVTKDGTETRIAYADLDYVGTYDDTAVSADPKVGDYFYSDGTWSDGGLISIDADGRNAKWADERPEPVEGKTVVGIVFTTNPDRIAEADKEAGYTHGYVIGCKNITDPGKSNYAQYPETVWYGGQYTTVDVIKVSKVAKTCYENINGREETQKLFDGNDEKYYSEDLPMFYYGTTKYPVEAPSNTSGWFIPSVGQMWDCIANFCSGEVADYLAEQQEASYDFTYYVSNSKLSSSPFESFMKVFEKVPAADKDEITIPDSNRGGKSIAIGTSSRYSTESRVIFNLGMEGYGLVEGMEGWFDEEAHARPIFAF